MSYPGSDKVKIAHTLDPALHTAQSGAALAPEEPVMERTYWCSERCIAVEQAAHGQVAAQRHRGEWFQVSIAEADLAIVQAAGQLGVEIKKVFDREDQGPELAGQRQREQARLRALALPALQTELRGAHARFSAREENEGIAPNELRQRFESAYPDLATISNERFIAEKIQPSRVPGADKRQRSADERRRILAAVWIIAALVLVSLLAGLASEYSHR